MVFKHSGKVRKAHIAQLPALYTDKVIMSVKLVIPVGHAFRRYPSYLAIGTQSVKVVVYCGQNYFGIYLF